MASIINKLMAFARSPKGQQTIARAQRELGKPGNQDKLRKLSGRLRGGGSGGTRHH
ncbi:hypothetical protein [Cryptosporangium minutisporangium]|uniref:Uncharacterized protein n=1 Tax=Cryptosporangium minutisporangium TaxID=113569 RepID=A0ABP6STR7_9ACTN